LGTDAGDRGDNEQAIFHLNRALEISPKSLIIINNLAWYLAIKNEPDLNRAFELIDTLITQAKVPSAQLYDTRGMINLKLGKFNSALSDLERSLPQLENDAGIHERLSRAYEKLGNSDLSTSHKKRAEELNAKKGKTNKK
jgi:tetratricopeptide (TPR) repeat protein